MEDTASVMKKTPTSKGELLGTLRLRHERTNEILLIPRPSNDPNDPLNWPYWYKYYVTGLASWSIFLCTFSSAGPAVLIPDMAITFFGAPPPGPGYLADFLRAVGQTSYFFTVAALTMGVSNALWVPLMINYGRRPVYVASFLLLSATCAWSARAASFAGMLAARTLLGCAAGAGEVLGPLTIADLFFVHERGRMMVVYTCLLSVGTSLGAIVSGLVTIHHDWRLIFWVCLALAGATTLVMLLSMPETVYMRDVSRADGSAAAGNVGDDNDDDVEKDARSVEQIEQQQTSNGGPDPVAAPPTQGFPPSVAAILRTPPPRRGYTSEALWKLALRPLVLIVLPSALWASLVMAVSIGFLVAMSTNVSTAFGQIYGFRTWQIGASLAAGVVGSVAAVWFGGPLSDRCSDYLTRRNGGVKEPEFRLPAMLISLVTGPLALILYGVGVGKGLHWICPVFGLGLINFTIVQAANISVVYMIDCYRPIAGEVTQTQYGFKSLFGFLLSFYTNPWIEHSGYIPAFGEMAAISFAVFFFSLVFYVWGKKIRRMSWNWPVLRSMAHWDSDREVGE
ncbi:major facilitator superfamily domain-containing protein [Xylariomycetidae sp. FL2044]|nr:major facilitator superfamily domain-containing protein [Xylariomycetidae sp. FL2044]